MSIDPTKDRIPLCEHHLIQYTEQHGFNGTAEEADPRDCKECQRRSGDPSGPYRAHQGPKRADTMELSYQDLTTLALALRAARAAIEWNGWMEGTEGAERARARIRIMNDLERRVLQAAAARPIEVTS